MDDERNPCYPALAICQKSGIGNDGFKRLWSETRPGVMEGVRGTTDTSDPANAHFVAFHYNHSSLLKVGRGVFAVLRVSHCSRYRIVRTVSIKYQGVIKRPHRFKSAQAIEFTARISWPSDFPTIFLSILES